MAKRGSAQPKVRKAKASSSKSQPKTVASAARKAMSTQPRLGKRR